MAGPRKQATPQTSSPPVLRRKKWLELPAAILAVALLFSFPNYHEWLFGQIWGYYQQFPRQWRQDDFEERLIERCGFNYLVPRLLFEFTREEDPVLLPPREYVQRNFSQCFFWWSGPVNNYYYTGRHNFIPFAADSLADYTPAVYAIVCRHDREKVPDNFPRENLLAAMNGDDGILYLVKIDSPNILETVVAEYRSEE